MRYKLVYRMPEVVDPNFQLLDRLPAGLQFLNDGTATVSFVANYEAASLIHHSQPAALSDRSAPSCTWPSPAPRPLHPRLYPAGHGCLQQSGSNDDTYGDGTDVYFKLGT